MIPMPVIGFQFRNGGIGDRVGQQKMLRFSSRYLQEIVHQIGDIAQREIAGVEIKTLRVIFRIEIVADRVAACHVKKGMFNAATVPTRSRAMTAALAEGTPPVATT